MKKIGIMSKFKKNCMKALLFAAVTASLCHAGIQQVSAKDAEGNTVIVIDPGHGGDDPGKIGVNGVHEEDVNYEIAKAMMRELEKCENVRVYMTRGEDEWNTNTGRAMVAAGLNADFLVSIHNNSGTETSSGAIVFTSVLPLYSTITADMGNYILGNLSALGIANNGIQTRNSTDYPGEDYYTIMGEAMRAGVPTVLVEHCFLSSPEDSLFVSHSDGSLDYDKIGQIGQADATAVITYFNLQENTAVADSVNGIELEKGYSVRISPAKEGTGSATWSSSNDNSVQVDQYGLATAVNSGNATITYSYEDGTTGSIEITVNVPTQIALVGSLDPTFYGSLEELGGLKTDDIFANVIYSDGSAVKVVPDRIGDIDYNRVGVQDIEVSYGMLSGKLRIICDAENYVPEVTSREIEPETEPPAETETGSEEISVTESQPHETTSDDEEAGVPFEIMMVVKLAAGVIIVVIFGTIIYLLENKMSRKRRNKRRRRY